MTYLALARKWRPRTFADVAGQGHVVRALENSLNSGKVHHAFLFTGTRGVGKTTIARIFVKALNCERAVSAEPCGECSSCLAIDQGRFVDFLEVDAASRTGIDDARELLDNAQYTPAAGRFKVFLIDEVHMLSKPAFNALLKTLEEPPPHVKFLLATTDPQKIPVTVLSRCLQFNLKRLTHATIVERLALVCKQEKIVTETSAIARIARAAAGSMRDGLSVLDQALAFGDGQLRDADVAEMLGSLDRARITALIEALAVADAAGLMAQVRQLDELAPDYGDVLAGLATVLQRVAVAQVAGSQALESDGAAESDLALVLRLAEGMTAETVQLMYQIAVMGRRDLPLAPDPRTGFEMALLRMVAFHPERHLPAAVTASTGSAGASSAAAPPAARPAPVAVRPAVSSTIATHPSGGTTDIGDWSEFVGSLNIDGAARQLAAHCALVAQSPFEIRLTLDKRNGHLLTDKLRGRLTAALHERLGSAIKVLLTIAEAIPDRAPDTPAARQARNDDDDLRRARAKIAADTNVQQMAELFGAEVIPESIRQNPKSPSRK
ncbi:MAG: DNA polymerase III subunit gamma/tau [Chromatiales bacterium]|jgi:DNA polymerase-3 subunit gamma/tau|nr:MAG: DNA polymerase III subunit gamma/tau [Chromatiales bacterium]